MTSEGLSCIQIDDSFRLYADSCRGGFDFTLLFEEAILAILPLSLLLLVSAFRIRYLLERPKKVVISFLLPFKIVRRIFDFRPYLLASSSSMLTISLSLGLLCRTRRNSCRSFATMESTIGGQNKSLNSNTSIDRWRNTDILLTVIL
jgi:hypothetical protein